MRRKENPSKDRLLWGKRIVNIMRRMNNNEQQRMEKKKKDRDLECKSLNKNFDL